MEVEGSEMQQKKKLVLLAPEAAKEEQDIKYSLCQDFGKRFGWHV